MAYDSIITEVFEHDHENEQFRKLDASLKERFSLGSDPHLLIGNLMCNGVEVDAVFIKKNAFCVIEMKSMSGAIRFTENGPWRCDGTVIKAGKHGNPFRQARSYRYKIMEEFGNWEREGALQAPGQSPWGHIACIVLFGDQMELEGRIPDGINKWFQVSDLASVVDRFADLSSPILNFSRYDFDLFRERLGGKVPLEEKTPVVIKKRVRLVYDRNSGIQGMLRILRKSGGNSLRAAQVFEERMKKAGLGGDPLEDLPFDEIPEIGNARRFQLSQAHGLVVIAHEDFICPVALGTDDYVDEWSDSNRGGNYVIDQNGRITFTYVDGKGADEAVVTEKNIPLLKRIEVDLDELVPHAFIRNGLLGIDESSDDQYIDYVLEAIQDESIRGVLSDLIYRLRAGDLNGAEARLALWLGNAVEVSEIGLSDSPVDTGVNSDNLIDIETLDPDELKKLFDPERFAEWMIFLHPEQRRIAHANYGYRALLTGVSGSGKTCVLVHRARVLARKYPDQKIGILTLNRSLSRLLDNLVTQLCGEEGRENITVLAFYDYFKQLVDHYGPGKELDNLIDLAKNDSDYGEDIINTLRQVNPDTYARHFDPLSGETVEDTWEIFMEQPVVQTKMVYFRDALRGRDPGINAESYLKEEFSLIRSGCITDGRIDEYLALKREGRSIPLTEKDRRNVLDLLLLFEETMIHGGILDELGLTLAVTPHMQELAEMPEELKFRCLLVDEFQDLSTRDIAVLQKTVPQLEDALFLTGDMVQQVLVKTLSLSKLGFLKGSFDREHITRNYRNSKNILLAANDLILKYGRIAHEQNEELEVLDPEFAIRETVWPRAVEVEKGKEIQAAWEWVGECLSDTGAVPWSVCIVTSCPEVYSVDDIIAQRPADFHIEVEKLSGDYAGSKDIMTVGAMSDVKGFEFSAMIVVGCGSDCLPTPGRTVDEVWRDALRLYVAMTRARDQVVMLYSGQASEILLTMNKHIEWETFEWRNTLENGMAI